jgi:glycosyltransferase involved in cell wall biosynthesis
MNTFDVVIASFNRSDLLDKCLNRILNQLPSELGQILVLTQSEDAETTSLLRAYSSKTNKIKNIVVTDIPPPGESRNILIKNTKSEFIYFVDDDAFVPDHYFDTALSIIKETNVDVFGGPDQYHNDSGIRQKVLGEIMQEKLVMGPTFKRHSRSSDNLSSSEVELTLCNLWIKSEIFKTHNFSFDSKLMRCEENVLLEQIQSSKFNLSYFNDLYVYHFRREGLRNIVKIQLKSGYYRGICFYKEKRTFKAFFLLPILTGFILIISPLIPFKVMLPLVITHNLIAGHISIKLAYKLKSIFSFFYSMILITLIHIGFSVGICSGFFKGMIGARE